MRNQIWINNRIRANEVRVIDEQGTQLGVLPIEQALRMAQEKNLDLIQITSNVEPPVCKIEDYGKFLYQADKKARESRKHTGGGSKELRLTFNISPHDMDTRIKQAEKFLKKGDLLHITLRLRGRQKALETHAREKIQQFLEKLQATTPVRIERPITREPNALTLIVTKQ